MDAPPFLGPTVANLNNRKMPDDLVVFVPLAVANNTVSGKLNTVEWANPTGQRLKIVRARAGSWLNYGLRADVVLAAFRKSDGSLIIDGGIDHYAEPNLPFQGWPQDFGQYAMYLDPDDVIRIVYGFTAFVPQGMAPAPVGVTQNVTIWCPAGG